MAQECDTSQGGTVERGPYLGFAAHFAISLRLATDTATVDEVVARVGLPHPLKQPSDTRITVVQEAAFIEAVSEASGDIDFALLTGLKLAVGTALPGYISQNSETLRDALMGAAKVLPLVRPGCDFCLEELGNVATVRLTISDPALHSYPRHREALFAGVIGQIRSFTARPFHPELLAFRHSRMAVGPAVRSSLMCPVEFGAEHSEMLINTPVLDRPIRGRDGSLHSLLVHHGELLSASLTQDEVSFAERVELHVQEALSSGNLPDADSIARSMGVSRRTLSRRLLEAETSFADILSHVRLRFAARELRETDRQIGEISWQLGYSNQSAFATAFRRVTGLTPREFRSGEGVLPDLAG